MTAVVAAAGALAGAPAHAASKFGSKTVGLGNSILRITNTGTASVSTTSTQADSRLDNSVSLCVLTSCVTGLRANAEAHSLGGSRMLQSVLGTTQIRPISVSGSYAAVPLIKSKSFSPGFTVAGTGVYANLSVGIGSEVSGTWTLSAASRRADLVNGRGRLFGSGSASIKIGVPLFPDPTVGSISVNLGPTTRLNAFTGTSLLNGFCASNARHDFTASLKASALGITLVNSSATASHTLFSSSCPVITTTTPIATL
jgi:hypothetical protein